jgi:hypothetical protein
LTDLDVAKAAIALMRPFIRVSAEIALGKVDDDVHQKMNETAGKALTHEDLQYVGSAAVRSGLAGIESLLRIIDSIAVTASGNVITVGSEIPVSTVEGRA